MIETRYLNFLIFGVILSHGIIGISSDYMRLSSNFHIREKRVINHEPDGNSVTSIRNFPYIVNLKEFGIIVCTGSILSHYVVITAAHCVSDDRISVYKVFSSSINAHLGILHDVERKIIHNEYDSVRLSNDIALLKIHPRIEYNAISRNIELHIGPLSSGTIGVVSGWGCRESKADRVEHSDYLLSINVPIITSDHCKNIYRGHYNVPERCICTLDTSGQKKCANGDSGAPLVVNSHLVGVYSGRGQLKDRPTPDVFVNVADPKYASWINSILHTIESREQVHQNHYHLHNPHNSFFHRH